MKVIARSDWIRSLLLTVGFWTSFAFLVQPALQANPESAPRAVIAAGCTITDKESFSLFHLDATTGFSFARAQYSGVMSLQGYPNVPPPNAVLSITFKKFSPFTVQPIAIRMDDDDLYEQSKEHGKFNIAINPFAANPVFDFGTKNGIKAPNNFDTGDPTLVAVVSFKKSIISKIIVMSFRISTFARAGGAFNVIQGYVPSITAGVNTGTFHSSDGHKITVDQTVTVQMSIPGGNTWSVDVPLNGDASRATRGKNGDYKITGDCKGSKLLLQ